MYAASRSLSHNMCVYSRCNLLRPCTVHYLPSRRSCSLHSSANIATCSGVYGSILAVFTLVRLHPFLHLMFSMGLCNHVLLFVVKRMSGLRGFITGFCLITPIRASRFTHLTIVTVSHFGREAFHRKLCFHLCAIFAR